MKLYLVLQRLIKVLVIANVSYLNGGMMIKLLYQILMELLLSKCKLIFFFFFSFIENNIIIQLN